MKLASIKSNGRDGELVIVSCDLSRATRVPHIAKTMQNALDNWQNVQPKLQAVYEQLNDNVVSDAFPFEASNALAPLPRAYQWADGSAYVNHVELVRKARGAELPDSFWHDPLMYQGGSDNMIGANAPIQVASTEYGIDFEAEIAVITDDVPMGISPDQATDHIQLFMILNDVSLRSLIPAELGKGFGFFHSKPATAFAPVAVTPDELGSAWDGKKVHLPLITHLNTEKVGEPEAGVDMTFDFPTLVSHAAKTRFLGAGCIIGSGTISNLDRSKGSSCLAEKRMLETIANGKPQTPFMQFGDRVRIEMLDLQGNTIFGAIDQVVEQYEL